MATYAGRIPDIVSDRATAGAAERQNVSSRGWSVAEPHRHQVKESAIGKSGKSFNNHWLTTISH